MTYKCNTKESHNKVNKHMNEICVVLDENGNIVFKGTRRESNVFVALNSKMIKWIVAPLR